ncbi:hypothetical protein D5R89_16025 [Vibrio cholerae]|nr:hypothetical protein D5R89_16025 [Vibrio cholerae]
MAVSLRSSIAKRRSHLNAALCAFLLNTPSLLIYPKKFRLLHSLCHEFYRMSFGIICPQDADS